MNAKHTPGPWQVNKKYQMSVESVADGHGINLIAECSDPDGERSSAEDMANAALIAAAPDLLAALQDLVENGIGTQSVQVARAAIAKATRGQS